MNRPAKDEVLQRLRAFSADVRNVAMALRDGGVAAEVVDVVDAVTWRATYLSERLLSTGRDDVHPDMANQLIALVRALEATLPSVLDATLSSRLADTAKSMRAFIVTYEPRQTESGRFMFHFEGDEQSSR